MFFFSKFKTFCHVTNTCTLGAENFSSKIQYLVPKTTLVEDNSAIYTGLSGGETLVVWKHD